MLEAIRTRLGLGKKGRTEKIEYAPLPVIRTSIEEGSSVDEAYILDGEVVHSPSSVLTRDERTISHPDLPGPSPTASQAVALRRVPAKLSWITYAIALVEMGKWSHVNRILC